MMSYQDCQPLYKYHEEELIALFVETLTGTTFEMTVSPYETIMSIKSKIQRVEGIPVSQQHLLYNLHELEDSAVLMDYSITNGSTIKLVLSMRGGPMSTVRRILPLDDITWKELIDFNRDDLIDDIPPGCRMAVLVFREGDQLNMFRVLENIDGSYSPLSDSWSGSSMRNLFEEEDSDDCDKRRLEENTVTMEKMNDLKNKLEQLAIKRRNHKLMNSGDQKGIKSVRNPVPPESYNSGEDQRIKSLSVNSCKKKNILPQLVPLESDKNDSSELDCEGKLRNMRTAEFSRVPVLPDISPSIAVFDSNVKSVAVTRPKTSPDHLTGHRICEILSVAGRQRLLGAQHCNASPLQSIPPVPSEDNNFETDWYSNRHRSSTNPLDKPSTSANLYRANSTLSDKKVNRTTVVSPLNIFQERSSSGNSISSLLSTAKLSKLPIHNIACRRNMTSHTAGINSNKVTLSSFQSLPSNKIDPVGIKPKYSGMSTSSRSKPSSLFSESSRNLTNFSSYPLTQSQSEEFRKKMSPNYSNSSTEKVCSSKSERLSPVCGVNKKKKKKKEPKSRCMKCNKRLTLTNTYTCRCGHVFCTSHRYSEAHDCTYDYKTEGRKILEQNNPLISAPKLPKI